MLPSVQLTSDPEVEVDGDPEVEVDGDPEVEVDVVVVECFPELDDELEVDEWWPLDDEEEVVVVE